MSAEQREAAVKAQLASQGAKDAERAKTEAQVAESEARFRSPALHYQVNLTENLGISGGISGGGSPTPTVNLVENLGLKATPQQYAQTKAEVARQKAEVQSRIQQEKANVAALQARESQIKTELESIKTKLSEQVVGYEYVDKNTGIRKKVTQSPYDYKTLDALTAQQRALQTELQTISVKQTLLGNLTSLESKLKQQESQIIYKESQQKEKELKSRILNFANPGYALKESDRYTGKQKQELSKPEYKDRPRIQTEQPGTLFGKTTFVQDAKTKEPELSNVAYTISLTEGREQGPRDLAISLSEGAPSKPRELTQEQVNKLSGSEYAVYQAEYAAYNKYVAEKNREATAKNLAGWQEYKGDLLGEIAGLKEKGVTSLSIGYKEGDEQKGKQVPIDRAFFEIITTKNVTGIGVPLDVPEGYTVVGSPGINMAYYPVEENRYGPDEAYTGMFKDPKKGTKDYDVLASLGRNVKRTGESFVTETAKLGLTLVGGIGALGLKVKGEEPILIGNATIPEELEQAPVISAPLTQQIQQTPAQKAVAASGGGDYTQRNVQSVQIYLSALEQAKAKDATRKYGEDPFVFALKEQKKQGALENYLDVREGVTAGLTRGGETLITIGRAAPEAVYESARTGDFGAGTKVLEKRLAELETRLPPGVINTLMTGGGTGRSPYYNIGGGIGEVLPDAVIGLVGIKGPKDPLFAKPPARMSGVTKARVITKAQAAENIYGVEAAIEGRAATGFVSKRIEALKAKFRQPRQFIGGIGTEAERDLFKPLSNEPEIPGAKVTPAKPDVTAIGPKGERVRVKAPEIVEPTKGKPSETPALVIDTGEKGLTGVVRATPKEKIENQIGIIVRGDVTPGNLKRLGLKQVSTDEKGVPVFAARLPKGEKKREKFFSILSEAEELGFIKRVTDIDFIPTERALGIAKGEIGGGQKVRGRKDITLGERKESYGPRQLRNEFQTAPYYETTASMGTPRELRVKGTTEGVTVDEAFRTGKLPKGKPKLEDEFGLTGVDAGLKEAGLSPALKPRAEKGIKKFEDFAKPIEQGKGGAGRGGKIEPISQEKALDIAASIKPLTQGVTAKPTVIEKPVVPISGYEFETEVTGKYTRTIPSDLSGSRIETGTRDMFRTESRLDARQKDILGEAAKQVQPQATMQGIRIETITGSKQKEREMEKSAVAERLIFGQETKTQSRQALGVETITAQKLKQPQPQKLIEPIEPVVPEELKPRFPRWPTVKFPEIERRKTKREKEEKKEAIPFIGNVFEEQVQGGFPEFDIKYGQKKVSKQSALGLSITRKGREKFMTGRTESVLPKRGYMFTEKKPKKIGKDGFAKPGKKYSW